MRKTLCFAAGLFGAIAGAQAATYSFEVDRPGGYYDLAKGQNTVTVYLRETLSAGETTWLIGPGGDTSGLDGAAFMINSYDDLVPILHTGPGFVQNPIATPISGYVQLNEATPDSLAGEVVPAPGADADHRVELGTITFDVMPGTRGTYMFQVEGDDLGAFLVRSAEPDPVSLPSMPSSIAFTVAVPEPGALILLVGLVPTLLARRGRRKKGVTSC